MVYFIICEIHGFPHQFPVAWENAVTSIELGEPRKLVPIFYLTYGYFSSIRFTFYGILCYHMGNTWFFPSKSTLWPLWFFHSIIFFTCSKIYWFLKRRNRKKPDKVNYFFKKRKPVRGTLEFKAKYVKRRRGNGCNFIKNKEYKYVLGKSMPSHTNLFLFLIISSKNYIPHPNILTKSVATVVFVRKESHGSSFKKDSQFISDFSNGMWSCGCAASQTFLSYSSNCH